METIDENGIVGSMTAKAKEKAIELVDKFTLYLGTDVNGDECYVDIIEAKRCALICVDEILKNIPEEVMSYKPFMMNTDYWQEVRQEII